MRTTIVDMKIKIIKYIIAVLLTLTPFLVHAQISYTHSMMAECPVGYICTPTLRKFEKIYYVSPAYLTEGLKSIQENITLIDIIAPQVYEVDSNFQATGSVPIQIQTIAKSNNIKVMPLITNHDFSQSLMHNFLASSTAEDSVISYLVSEAQKQGYMGWQFDFEHMMATDSEPYSSFVKKTAKELQKHNLVLSVAVVVRANDDTSTKAYKNWSGVYDYGQIANYADFISIMTYDDPNSIGPTASIPYDKSVLAYLSEKVPPEKISLGIPFFYYGWDLTPPNGQTTSLPVVPSSKDGEIVRYGGIYSRWKFVKENYGLNQLFDSGLGVSYSTYYIDGHKYQAWYDNEISVQMKLDLAKSRHLRGFSAWALGQEFPDVWKAISNYK